MWRPARPPRVPPRCSREARRPRHKQVRVDTDEPIGSLPAHRVGDDGAYVAALGDVAGVAQAGHELGPRLGEAGGVPTELGWRGREAVPGERRQHEVKGVLGATAVRGRVGERADDLEQLDDRARPAVRDDQRQRVLVPGLHVDEMHVHAVDLGLELRQRVQPRLAPAPVVLVRPVAGQLLDRLQLDALRAVCDQLLRRQPHRGDAAPEVLQGLVRELNVERANRGVAAARPGFKSNSGYLLLLRLEDGTAPPDRRATPSFA